MELKEAEVRQYYVTRERQSYSLALDYQFNPLNKISFKGIYNRRSDWENRFGLKYKDLNDDPGKQEVEVQTKAGSSNNKDRRLELQQTTRTGDWNCSRPWTSPWTESTTWASSR